MGLNRLVNLFTVHRPTCKNLHICINFKRSWLSYIKSWICQLPTHWATWLQQSEISDISTVSSTATRSSSSATYLRKSTQSMHSDLFLWIVNRFFKRAAYENDIVPGFTAVRRSSVNVTFILPPWCLPPSKYPTRRWKYRHCKLTVSPRTHHRRMVHSKLSHSHHPIRLLFLVFRKWRRCVSPWFLEHARFRCIPNKWGSDKCSVLWRLDSLPQCYVDGNSIVRFRSTNYCRCTPLFLQDSYQLEEKCPLLCDSCMNCGIVDSVIGTGERAML